MTSAVVAPHYGPPDVLELVDVEVPAPGPGQVVVDVRAAGTNPADVKSYSGEWGTDPNRLPMRLGFEASGVVRAVGPDAVGPAGPVAVGDEVVVFRTSGAYAERLLVRAPAVLPKPAELPWDAAAGLLLAGTTAIHTVVAAEVREGETVLVHGGSGGVGLMAVQLAAAQGARVIATARPTAHDLLRELGAEPVTYGPGLADRVRGLASRVDAAIDTVGTDEALDSSLELGVDPQRIASIAAFERGARLGIRLLGSGPGDEAGDELRLASRRRLIEDAAAGRLRVVVAATFPLADVAEAHRALMGAHSPGKIVLTV
ncbi:NADP-dependent oxidoreductase [Angustibacter sp. Root456]|uniref:quinone oxidoreductase family protein n=1 Tax=Angustibacter sp. Root456 TaxID=1736539 RepID=UPI0006FCF06B|nr:NADP-dependent oxidoreductase [Angustibacter sp. Root456]KQX69642.1 alcohol dehydrogenase [Angustibacter sp. Root456]